MTSVARGMLTHPNTHTHTHAHIFGSDAGKSDQVRGIEWLVQESPKSDMDDRFHNARLLQYYCEYREKNIFKKKKEVKECPK